MLKVCQVAVYINFYINPGFQWQCLFVDLNSVCFKWILFFFSNSLGLRTFCLRQIWMYFFFFNVALFYSFYVDIVCVRIYSLLAFKRVIFVLHNQSINHNIFFWSCLLFMLKFTNQFVYLLLTHSCFSYIWIYMCRNPWILTSVTTQLFCTGFCTWFRSANRDLF